MDSILRSFLERQREDGLALAAASDILELCPLDGPPPQHYIARFRARGLVKPEDGEVCGFDLFDVGIRFPDDYLRLVSPAEVLTYLGPHVHPWHPNIRPPFICVTLTPGTPLVDLCYTLYELWTWRLFNTGDEGLNHAASQWLRHQEATRFPTDPRPLKRRALNLDLKASTGLSEGRAC